MENLLGRACFDISKCIPKIIEDSMYGPFKISIDNEKYSFYMDIRFSDYIKGVEEEHIREYPLYPIGSPQYQYHPLLSAIFSFLTGNSVISVMCLVNSHFKKISEKYHVLSDLEIRSERFIVDEKNVEKLYNFSRIEDYIRIAVLVRGIRAKELRIGSDILRSFVRFKPEEESINISGICRSPVLRYFDLPKFQNIFSKLQKLIIISSNSDRTCILTLDDVVYLINNLPKLITLSIEGSVNCVRDTTLKFLENRSLQILQISESHSIINSTVSLEVAVVIEKFVIEVYEKCKKIRMMQVPFLKSEFYKQSSVYYNENISKELKDCSNILTNSPLKDYLRRRFLDSKQNFILENERRGYKSPVKISFDFKTSDGEENYGEDMHFLVDGIPVKIYGCMISSRITAFVWISTYLDAKLNSLDLEEKDFFLRDDVYYITDGNKGYFDLHRQWEKYFQFRHASKINFRKREMNVNFEIKKVHIAEKLKLFAKKVEKGRKYRNDKILSYESKLNNMMILSNSKENDVIDLVLDQQKLLNESAEAEIVWKSDIDYSLFYENCIHDIPLTMFNDMLFWIVWIYPNQKNNTLYCGLVRQFGYKFVVPVCFKFEIVVSFEGMEKRKYNLESSLQWFADIGDRWGFGIKLPKERRKAERVEAKLLLEINKEVISSECWVNKHKKFALQYSSFSPSPLPISEEKELVVKISDNSIHQQTGIIQDNDVDRRNRTLNLCGIDFSVEFLPFGMFGWCVLVFNRVHIASGKLKIHGKFTVTTISSVKEDLCYYPEGKRNLMSRSKRVKFVENDTLASSPEKKKCFIVVKNTQPDESETFVNKIHPCDPERKLWKFIVKFELYKVEFEAKDQEDSSGSENRN